MIRFDLGVLHRPNPSVRLTQFPKVVQYLTIHKLCLYPFKDYMVNGRLYPQKCCETFQTCCERLPDCWKVIETCCLKVIFLTRVYRVQIQARVSLHRVLRTVLGILSLHMDCRFHQNLDIH